MTSHELLVHLWRLNPFALFASTAAGVAYVRAHRRIDPARALWFAGAIVVLVIALASPIGVLADGYLFSAHMLQHLLLVLVVPLFALLGVAPILPEKNRAIPAPVTWAAGVGAMWIWHAPTLCNAAAESGLVHTAQEASLLVMGTAFFWPIVGPRISARLSPLAGVAYLFTACVACTILGVMITFSPVEVCSIFAHPKDALGVLPLLRNEWGLTVEKDQQVGGLLMWVPACTIYGVTILGVLSRLYTKEDA